MANKNPVKKFKKGNTFGGRKKLPEGTRRLRHAGMVEFVEIVDRVHHYTKEEAKKLDLDSMTFLERVIIKAYIDSNHKMISEIWNRMWGKAREQIDIEMTSDNKIKYTFEVKRIERKDSDRTK